MKKNYLKFIVNIFFIFIAAALIILLWKNNILLTIIASVLTILAIYFYYGKNDIFYFIVGFFIGSIGEIICIQFGVWQYANPTFLGIPLWLPLVWGNAVVLIRNIAGFFSKR